MLGRDELVLELPHLLLGAVEDLAESARCLRLQVVRALHRGLALQVGLGLRTDLGSALAEERLRQLLVEERQQQMLGMDLGVAATPRKLLRGRDRLL